MLFRRSNLLQFCSSTSLAGTFIERKISKMVGVVGKTVNPIHILAIWYKLKEQKGKETILKYDVDLNHLIQDLGSIFCNKSREKSVTKFYIFWLFSNIITYV